MPDYRYAGGIGLVENKSKEMVLLSRVISATIRCELYPGHTDSVCRKGTASN